MPETAPPFCYGGHPGFGYEARMEPFLDFLRRNSGWPLGVLALAAWFLLLYKMFGDVL